MFALKVHLYFAIWRLCLVLLDVLRRTRQGERWVCLCWHPLLAIEVAGSGHVDIVGVLLLLYPSPHWCPAGVRLQPWRLGWLFH